MDWNIIAGYRPGAIGRVTELHAAYYQQHWGFGLYFEAKIATELAAFMQSFNPRCDGFWTAVDADKIIGSVAIVAEKSSPATARLRWLIVAQEYQSKGLGKGLMQEAIGFCKKAKFRRVYLTTFAGLDAARHLYEQEGFKLVEEREDCHWGKTVSEQTFELIL